MEEVRKHYKTDQKNGEKIDHISECLELAYALNNLLIYGDDNQKEEAINVLKNCNYLKNCINVFK